MRGNTKAPRGDLLDLGDAIGAKPVGVLAPLTTIGARADMIHSHCQCFVSLGGQRAEGHPRRIKTSENVINGLHLIQRYGRSRRLQ